MEEFVTWMTENAQWVWWSLAVILLAGEMVLPGVYLLWLGIAMGVTGVFAWVAPDLGFQGHGLIFAFSATVSIYVGHRYFYMPGTAIKTEGINERGNSYVGQVFEVVVPIKNGRGHVKVGDSRWLARGPDLEKGALAKVVSVDGTVLVVEAA
ncbi:MAG: NfeD family protein [Kordiimonadaceae bacterium]|nr:NfeD family protein [Kordiimonadaceae bacterium]MBO6567190.1 NfeD family protein [Kordiimonadaceae bacterium]MBO6963595.1 NfeD family protein [Kordiimonadaceae bacterium]